MKRGEKKRLKGKQEMIDYIKNNHLGILALIEILALIGVITILLVGGKTTVVERPIGASETTTISNPWTFQEAVTLNKTLSVTGTSTQTQSVDGLVVGGTIPTTATGTVRTVYTNSTGPKLCDSTTAYLYLKNNGSFAPSLIWSMGTSTSAAAAATNLVASSTVATTTTTLINPADRLFLLDNGETITAIFGDYMKEGASSTYFSRWSAEAGVRCQDVSI